MIIFEIGCHVFTQASLDCGLPTYASHVAGMTGSYSFSLIEMRSHKLFD
jgi:hypothetical protein